MTVLKLDHDARRYPAHWWWRLRWLARRMRWRVVVFAVSRSPHGWHGEVVLSNRVAPDTVVAAQAILGSHWAREGYNLMRVHSPAFRCALWRDRANVLYERTERKRP